MRRLTACVLSLALLLVGACSGAAETEAQAESVPLYTQAELDRMLAPIALYPDELLSQILMAATYPLEVVEAARWSRAHPELRGQDAVRAAEGEDWDPSVKAMLAFPQVLERMDKDLDWTRDLGDAFLAQQQEVMDTVQALRRRADEAGNLKELPQTRVIREERTIYVRSAYPDVIYVPYYDPYVVYGSWWWPSYRPVRWDPWIDYRPWHSSAFFYVGTGITIGHGFFFSSWDWYDHRVRIVEAPPFYYRRPPPPRYIWVHEHRHRRGVPYRDERVRDRYIEREDPRYEREYQRRERPGQRDVDRPRDGDRPSEPPAGPRRPLAPSGPGVDGASGAGSGGQGGSVSTPQDTSNVKDARSGDEQRARGQREPRAVPEYPASTSAPQPGVVTPPAAEQRSPRERSNRERERPEGSSSRIISTESPAVRTAPEPQPVYTPPQRVEQPVYTPPPQPAYTPPACNNRERDQPVYTPPQRVERSSPPVQPVYTPPARVERTAPEPQPVYTPPSRNNREREQPYSRPQQRDSSSYSAPQPQTQMRMQDAPSYSRGGNRERDNDGGGRAQRQDRGDNGSTNGMLRNERREP
ncbi:MAG: DUF3300 domain-containing protein [Gammaproteobacteria bacterium]